MIKKILVTEAQLSGIINIMAEDRGMFPNHQDLAKSIIQYVQDYVNKHKNKAEQKITDNITGDLYQIKLPNSLLSQLTWVDNKDMVISVIDITPEEYNALGGLKWAKKLTNGNTHVSDTDKLTIDKKLAQLDIEITLVSTNKNLVINYFGNVLYHELTHVYQNYNQLLKTGVGLYQHNTKTNYDEIMTNLQDPTSDENLRIFNIINYSLLNTAELNAIVAGVYGSLETLNSTRNNFQKDIQRISAYAVYDTIKNNYLPKLISLDDLYWDIFMHAAYQQKIKPTENNPSQLRKETARKFKQRFVNSVNFKLDELINRIGKMASKYYDDMEKQ